MSLLSCGYLLSTIFNVSAFAWRSDEGKARCWNAERMKGVLFWLYIIAARFRPEWIESNELPPMLSNSERLRKSWSELQGDR